MGISNTSLVTSIHNCARCGADHTDLEFKQFIIEPIQDSDGTVWNYWALCPTCDEPILLKVKDDQEAMYGNQHNISNV